MKSTLDAAEALLGTIEAARAHLLLIANQNLAVEDSLAFGAEARVGASPERALLHVATISLDLARVASGLAPGPGVVAEAEPADEPITRPDSPLPGAAALAASDPVASGLPEAAAQAPDGPDEAEPTEGIAAAEVLVQEAPSAAEEERPVVSPSLAQATERVPSAAAPPGFRVDDLVRGSLPEPLLPPWARAARSAPSVPADLEDGSDEPVASALGGSSAPEDPPPPPPTLSAKINPTLMAAVGQPKARTPSLGAAVSVGPSSAPAKGPWAPPSRPRPIHVTPELVERDELAEPAAVAAVQILGVGSARTLSPTLALDGATGSGEDESEWEAGASDPPGDLEVAFEEPEEDAETADGVPELTAEDSDGPDTRIIVTRDGVQHREGARVADADVAASQLDGLLFDAAAAEQRGNLREAVLHYSDLLSLKPSHAEAHLGRGRCLVDLGDYGAAMSDFQRAEDLEPGRPDALLEMGNLFYARKEYTKGISYYDQALEVSADFAMAWVRRGLCHQYLKDHEQAFADLQHAASLDADIPNLRMYIDMARKGMQRSDR